MVPAFFRLSLYRLLCLMLAYSITRLFFLIGNFEIFSHIATTDILKAFVFGLRFDLSAVLFTNAIFLLWWMRPSGWATGPRFQKIEIALFFVVNWIFLGMNIMDLEFYKFMGKRLAYDIFGIQKDVKQHSVTVLLSYWYLVSLVFLVTGILTWACYRKVDWSVSRELWQTWGWRVVALVLIVTGMRGGYQFKPLHPMNAYFTTSAEVGVLTLNSPFNFLKSRPKWNIPEADFFSTDAEAIANLVRWKKTLRPPLGQFKNWNVVLIIMESFGTEYLEYAPFVKKIMSEGYNFSNNFANGRRSIEALPSVLCGLPSLMYEPIVSSDFNNNEMHCLAEILKQSGYSTHFYHGAHNGSMYMDTFSKRAGFDDFIGYNEYPQERKVTDDDHIWGILDEPFLQYAIEKMDYAPKPFALGVFTLSSHHPYFIPAQLKGKFPKGPLEIHESIGYLDYSLQKFFERAEKSDWYKSTIFILTGDHTQKSIAPEFQTPLGKFRVPLVVWIPGSTKRLDFNSHKITQHIDIQPTILDLLGVQPKAETLFGQSLFDPGKGFAYNYVGNAWWMVDDQYLVDLNRTSGEVVAYRQTGALGVEPTKDSVGGQTQLLKSIVQYGIHGIVGNKLYRWEKR